MGVKCGFNFEMTYTGNDATGDLTVSLSGTCMKYGREYAVELDEIECTAWDSDGKVYPDAYRSGIVTEEYTLIQAIIRNADPIEVEAY